MDDGGVSQPESEGDKMFRLKLGTVLAVVVAAVTVFAALVLASAALADRAASVV